MKQIIPFQKELLFKTKVSEITSISLEHNLSFTSEDTVSGEFLISGDYKMTEGSINREKFNFQLPFDISLDSKYDMSSLVIDIDNFYYEIVNNESLKVNIDVYIEGKKLEEQKEEQDVLMLEKKEDEEPIRFLEPVKEQVKEVQDETVIAYEKSTNSLEVDLKDESKNSPQVVDFKEEKLDESVEYSKPDTYYLDEDASQVKGNDSLEFNIFENMDHSDTYVTYYVYIVKEDDTLDKIIQKYGVTREKLVLYNNLEDMKPGVKLIIPNADE